MRVSQITFNAGPTSDCPPTTINTGRVTIFIGPNNGGKSQALRDIGSKFLGHPSSVVVKNVEISPHTPEEYEERLNILTRPKLQTEDPDPSMVPVGRSGNFQLINKDALLSFRENASNWSHFTRIFLKHSLLNLGGENRLSLANPVNAHHLNEQPNSTCGAILKDDALRSKISNLVHQAFNQHLVIDPTGMSQWSYSLSSTPPINDIERSFTKEALEFFSKCLPVPSASDGTRAFVGILTEVMAGDHEVLIIDEPEAFLHPSLAYLLGKEICRNLGDKKQLLAATHSPHFLLGCIESGVDVEIVRLTFSGENSTARSLSASDLKAASTDPLLRSIGVTNALFYESAVVCEADADRAFYSEIASRLQREGLFRHTVFLNGHGKHTSPRILSILRLLGISSASIFDIDWIKEDGSVAEAYLSAANTPVGMREAVLSARRSVRTSLDSVNKSYKTSGGVGILTGDAKRTAEEFFDLMDRHGIFTVRSGELESWLTGLDISRTKNRWLPEVFAQLGSDPKTEDYLAPTDDDVWQFMRGLGSWLAA